MDPVKKIIDKLGLQPHVEGGYYKETFKSDVTVQLADQGTRKINTAIYYLLESNDFSCWHRLKSHEIWHYYCGSSVTIFELDTTGQLNQVILGNPLTHEQVLPQHVIAPNTWFAAMVNEPNTFSLVGCTVAPGFDFADFEMAEREKLCAKFPQHKEIILQLTREK